MHVFAKQNIDALFESRKLEQWSLASVAWPFKKAKSVASSLSSVWNGIHSV